MEDEQDLIFVERILDFFVTYCIVAEAVHLIAEENWNTLPVLYISLDVVNMSRSNEWFLAWSIELPVGNDIRDIPSTVVYKDWRDYTVVCT